MDLLHEILKADLPVPQATSNSTSNANTTLQLSEIIPDVSHEPKAHAQPQTLHAAQILNLVAA